MDRFAPEGQDTQEDIALMQRVFSAASRNPNLIPANFMSYALDYIQTNRLTIPIGQVTGFSQFTAQVKTGSFTPASITSTTSADPPDGAFTLAALPKGRYLMLYGGNVGIPAGGHGNILNLSLFYSPAAAVFDSGVSFKRTWNGAAVIADDETIAAMGAALFDLGNDSNDISLRASVSNAVPPSDAGLLGNRFIVAIRYANL